MNGAAQLSSQRREERFPHFSADEGDAVRRDPLQDIRDDTGKRYAEAHTSTLTESVLTELRFCPLFSHPQDAGMYRRPAICRVVAVVLHVIPLLFLLLWPLHRIRAVAMLPPSAVTVNMEPPSGMFSIEAPPVQHATASRLQQRHPAHKTVAPVIALQEQAQSRIEVPTSQEMPPPSLSMTLSMPVQSLPAMPFGRASIVALQASGRVALSEKSLSGSSSSSVDGTESSHAISAASAKGARTRSLHEHGVANWQGLLLARLEQFKRYPEEARNRGQQGVVYVHFTMDRSGHVLTSHIEQSSGYALLDKEALALMQRAQPLPKPPPEVPGNRIELVVPIQFSINEP